MSTATDQIVDPSTWHQDDAWEDVEHLPAEQRGRHPKVRALRGDILDRGANSLATIGGDIGIDDLVPPERTITFTTDVARGRKDGDLDGRVEVYIPWEGDRTNHYSASIPHPDGNRASRRRAASMARRGA